MDEKDFITRKEHEEFSRRLETESRRIGDENVRQNKRIDALEKITGQMNALIVSVEKMAVNMENMLSAIERQGTLIERQNERLDDIEKEPGKEHQQIKMTVITSITSAVVGAMIAGILTLV